jgi:cellulose biosynthesis protein BcsQ
MSVIAIYSPKGGVGKSTIAVDIAWRCATYGRARTLLWDLDCQGGASYLLGLDEDVRLRAASVFQREGRPQNVAGATLHERLDLLNADDSLRALPVQLARIGQRRRLAQLTLAMRREYDRIVLDCPPMQNEVSDQVIAAADVLIVPLPPSPLSARALDLLRRDLARNQPRHPPILPVLSLYDSRRKLHRMARDGRMAPFPVIPNCSELEKVAVNRAPVDTFARWSDGARALDRLWQAIEVKLAELKVA